MADPSSKAPASQLRLRKHADYQRAYAASRKLQSRDMSYFFALRAAMHTKRLHPQELTGVLSGPRVGLTVPKVLGKAHERNRIKRRMRMAVALHAGELAGLSTDVILHPRRSVLQLDWALLHQEVRKVFQSVRQRSIGPAAKEEAKGTQAKHGKKSAALQGKRTAG